MNNLQCRDNIIRITAGILLLMLFVFLPGCIDKSGVQKKETETATETATETKSTKHNYTICWLGDSLTQGSLGLDSDNLENAPYVKLSEITGNKVEGYGFYGYNAHEVLWVYSDENHENQRKDPSKVYVFWIGANDFASKEAVSTDAAPVIDDIKNFVSAGNIDKYVVLGCNPRIELRASGSKEAPYKIIDQQFEDAFGDRFMGIYELISLESGYCSDQIHLTQESYDIVADALAKKLQELDYL